MAEEFHVAKKDYSAFLSRIVESVRSGDDEDLHNIPYHFRGMHEVEKGKESH